MIGISYQPTAATHNSENIGLEPVWPYGVIGDSTTVNGDNLTALVDRTYNSKPNTDSNDWSFDAIDAARLDMGSQVSSDLVDNTEKYQVYISGLAACNPGSSDEPYIEQQSTVATTLDEALATDYDGTLRFAPAWPSGWNGSGTVYIQGGSKVDVQVEGGTIATAAIQAGTTGSMTVRNPWPGQQAEVVNGVKRRRGGGRHHRDDVQRAGDRRLVLPGRAAVVTDHRRCRSRRSPGPRRPRPSTWAACRSA